MDSVVPAGPEAAEEVIRRAQETLRLLAPLLGGRDLGARAGRDLDSAETTLRGAETLLLQELRTPGAADKAVRIGAALARIGAQLTSLRETRLAIRTAAMADMRRSLSRLRSAASLRELAEQVTVETNRLGYRRALFSRLTGPNWSPRSAYAYADPQLSADLVRIGTEVPGQIGRELPETEVVRSRATILVHDAQHNPGVHHRLINLARTLDYVVAPVVDRGQVIGLLHADQHVEHDHVEEFDVQVLGLFAEGLGCVFERVVYFEHLRSVRERLREQAGSVDDLLDGFPPAEPAPPERPDPLERMDGPFAELTRRELDVLRHLVLGRSNSRIADELFVSPGTVKTHVKNVLRKLGVANRAEATAKYHAHVQRRR